MKILLFSHDGGGNGGASKSFVSVIKGMKNNGHDLFIILPKKGSLINLLDELNIPYKIIPFTWWIRSAKYYTPRFLSKLKIWFILLILPFKTSFNYLRAIFKIKYIVKDFKPEVVYTNTFSHPVGILTSLAFKIKHIWHIREFVEEGLNARLIFYKPFVYKLLSFSDFIIYISNSLASNYQKPLNRYAIVSNAVYTQKDLLEKKDFVFKRQNKPIQQPIQLISIGRISYGKGHDVAIRTISNLKSVNTKAHLNIIGGGNSKPFKNLSQKLGIDNHVDFLGHCHNLQKYYCDADILIIASKKEAFGRVVIEAMAHGTIVIGRNSGGISDIIKNNINGFLFEEEKDIIRIIKNLIIMKTENIQEIRQNAYNDCLKYYTIEKLDNSIENILKSV